MSNHPTLYVIAETEAAIEVKTIPDGARDGSDTGGSFGREPVIETVTTLKRKRVPLDAIALKAQMDGLLQVVGDLFTQADQQTGMSLSEVELSVEINAEGQVSIIGNGGKLGNKGGITLKFVRH